MLLIKICSKLFVNTAIVEKPQTIYRFQFQTYEKFPDVIPFVIGCVMSWSGDGMCTNNVQQSQIGGRVIFQKIVYVAGGYLFSVDF